MLRRATRLLGAWLAVPFSRSRRAGFGWYVASGIDDTVRANGTVPQVAWAQDGEDLFFEEHFPPVGRYVDVGAHHPDRYSVTRKLYDAGWTGVNIDASPGFASLFGARRPRDTNVVALVGRARTATFWRFREGTLSTLDDYRARQLVDLGWELVGTEPAVVRSLTDVLDEADVVGAIDLLSVDVEGEDLDVLRSLDWSRWPVERCLVEIVEPAFAVADHPVARFLIDQGLQPTRVWGRSCLFERNFAYDPLDRSGG